MILPLLQNKLSIEQLIRKREILLELVNMGYNCLQDELNNTISEIIDLDWYYKNGGGK